jgi:protein-disulfide isomerase
MSDYKDFEKKKIRNKMIWGVLGAVLLSLSALSLSVAQEDKVVQLAIETAKTQMRVPNDVEIKFIEKKESPIPGFYSVKLLLLAPDREIPIVMYVDKEAEKVIVGSLFVKGENITRKEAGPPQARKIDMGLLEIDTSPFRGSADAKVAIVEFSNFQCPYCARSWTQLKGLLEKYPKELKYVFKHYPLQAQGKASEFSEMVAAVQEVNPEAFWVIHDFLFSNEGQTLLKGEKEPVKRKIEEILQQKGFDAKAFQSALETGKGKSRVERDLAVGKKIRVRGTPTTIINGELVRPPVTDKTLEPYLGK